MKKTHSNHVLALIVTVLLTQYPTFTLAAQTGGSVEIAYFLVEVQKETFVLAIENPQAIRDAVDCVAGRKRLIPIGVRAAGNGGFNTGWGWHLKPDTVRLVEVAMEVCDGIPSTVGGITSKYFCPWSARFVKQLAPPTK